MTATTTTPHCAAGSAIHHAMQTALAHHQAGRLAEAEVLYRRVLGHAPDHPDALHFLGILAGQVGRPEQAIALITRAIAVDPANASYHANLGEVYRRSGQWEPAIAHLRRALVLRSDAAEPHNNLGNVLWQTGRLEEAEAMYRRAIALKPDHAEAQTNLGVVLNGQGRHREAAAAHRRAIALAPELALAHHNLGCALKDAGRLDEAIAAFHRALQLSPRFAAAHGHLGRALSDQGRLDEAIAAYGQAIALDPSDASLCNLLGGAFKAQARYDEAIDAFRRAIVLEPSLVDAHNNLGCALRDQGRLDEAIDALGRAIALDPAHAPAHNNLGNALRDDDRLDEAIASFRQAIQLSPRSALAHSNLACALREQGRVDEALTSFRTAMELQPGLARVASNYLLSLHYHPGYSPEELLAEHRRWAARHAAPLAAESGIGPHPNDRTPGRKLRVGYVSADFRNHPVGRLLLPLFAHHDRGRIEVVAYSDVRVPDALTAQLQGRADAWRTCTGLGDHQLAEQVRADRIDILVDLALHTAGNRMLVFARRPAPVQATMLGMPSTTGLATMDYRLTDPSLDPPGLTDADYTERSLRLPHCYWCYEPPAEAPPPGPLPARSNGYITFGCLNQLPKASRPALEVWATILRSLPGSRLVLQAHPGSHRAALRGFFQERGVVPDRIHFVAPAPRAVYFARYHDLDACLDPFPYNGHTSTIDALWMGVPVITLAGRTAVGRGGVSILSNVGLPDLIAPTPEQYVTLAVALACDLTRLSELRSELRRRVQESPLMDGARYAADVEAALRQAWEAWCCR